jgi:hypothetical protein
MTDINAPQTTGTGARVDKLEVYNDQPADSTGEGWLFFAGTVLGLAGLMRILDAIWAFAYNGALPDKLQDGLLGSELNNYGWAWLIVGLVLITASFLILRRSQFARWIGYLAATIAALSAMTWMPYYPIWSMVYVGTAVLVFYALAKHGGRVA